MKFTLLEHDGCFGFEIEPESIADAALLVRFALNATKEVRGIDTTAYSNGTFKTYLVLGKRKKANGEIRP